MTRRDLPFQRYTPSRRRAFTLVETLLASIVTLGVLAAGTSMVLAVVYAANSIEAVSSSSVQCFSTVRKVTRAVHDARVIGYSDSQNVVLWVGDLNSDDKVELNELALIRFDATTGELAWYRAYDESVINSVVAPAVTSAALFTSATADSIRNSSTVSKTVWVNKADDFQIRRNTTDLDGYLLDARLIVSENGVKRTFASATTANAPGDYVVDATRSTNDGQPARRLRRLSSRVFKNN